MTNKIIDRLDGHCCDFIARAPFLLVATADAAGNCDVSPKGGAPGFVQVLDVQQLAVPDAPGNKLAYSLRNIVDTGVSGSSCDPGARGDASGQRARVRNR